MRLLCVVTVLFFSLIFKVQSHTFLLTSDFVERYEEYIKGKNLSIRLATIGFSYDKSDTYEVLDYTNLQNPFLMAIEDKSLPVTYSKIHKYRSFKFNVVSIDGKEVVGRILLQESTEKTYGSFFYLTRLDVVRKHQGKGIATKALKELITLFETINPYCQRFSLVIVSQNPKAGLVYARAGFWLYDSSKGKRVKDIDIFTDFILDQTKVSGYKIMIHDRGDALITIPTSQKEDKKAISSSLFYALSVNDKKNYDPL